MDGSAGALVLWLLAAGMVLVGIAGVVVPGLPGAILVLAGLVLAAWIDGFARVGLGTLAVLAALTAATYVLDLMATAIGARRFGISWWGVLGAVAGALIGLFFGVLYHAPDPLGYLKRIRAVTRQYVLIETVVDMLDVPRPALAYYPGAYLNGDASNHFGPNLAALEGLLSDAGFSRMEDLGMWRAHEIELTRGVPMPKGRPTSGRSVVRAWV